MGLLWFGRSKRKAAEREREAEAEPIAPAKQARVPVRLRGLLLLNLEPADGPERIETAPPLGRRSEVIEAIRDAIPGIAFDERGRGEMAADDHRVSIDLGREDPVATAVVNAEGDEGLERLRAIVERQRWRVYAPRAGVFIEPDGLDLFALPDDGLGSRRDPDGSAISDLL